MTTTSTQPVDVVVIGPSHLDSFASNIADGFDDLGICARVLDPFARFAGKGTIRAYGKYGVVMRRIVDQWHVARTRLVDRPVAQALEELDPRLVLSTFGYFEPGQVERWRRCTPHATWAMWYPDSFVNLGPHRALLAPYDHFFFKDPYIVDLLARRAELPAHYLAQACNPRHHRPPAQDRGAVDSTGDIVMIGNMYPYRLLTLERLDPKVSLKVYGNQRTPLPPRFSRLADAHLGEVVFGADKARVFAEAAIVLNTMHYGEVSGINSRMFEATGSGGFVLTHTNDGLHRYFEPGREVAVFETPDEMNSAIARYLADPEARAEIAAAGAARTLRDHTYPLRLVELVRICGLQSDAQFASLIGSR